MSLLQMAKAAVPQGLPVPGVARVWIEINSDLKTSANGNAYVNIKAHGVGQYEKSTVLDKIMLTADGGVNWSLMGARAIAAIAHVSNRSLDGSVLTADETPAVSDELIDQLIELFADGEAIVRLKKNDKGYTEIGAWLDPTSDNASDKRLLEQLGDADAIALEERPARGARPAPTARPASTSAAPRTAPPAGGAIEY